MSAVIGPDVGPYRVVRQLGAGGMGTVLLAEDTRLGRRVALKTIAGPEAQSAHGRRQLMREARAAAAINHSNIAAVHDVLDLDGRVVIVFEYVEGETLAARIARGPVPVVAALDIARQLASALVAAHARGVIHRDLKPANVMLDDEGRAKVLDFGIARLGPQEATASATLASTGGGLMGTPGYAAPEQWLGQTVDARADIYALGVVLFEMLTGERPFGGGNVLVTAGNVMQNDPPRVRSLAPGIPRELDDIVAVSLSRDPGERQQSAVDVERALTQVSDALVSDAPRSTRLLPGHRPFARQSVLLAVAAALALAVAAGVVRYRAPSPTGGPSRPPVVAVLPMNMVAGQASQEYLAAGVAESLITRLVALPSVTILSRAAVADARAREPDVKSLARDLDAEFLVATGVQQADDRLRVTLNLVRRDGSVAWAASFDGAFADIFDLQTRAASSLGEALAERLGQRAESPLAAEATADARALAAYWRGRSLLESRDMKGNVMAAVGALEEAVRLDPRFAIAYAALGEAYWTAYTDTRDDRWARQAIDAGTTALRLEPDRAIVRYSLGLTLFRSSRLDEAAAELRGALALQPNYDDARRTLGRVLARQGLIDEAVAEFRQAIAMRPAYWGGHSDLGVVLYEAGRYRDAAQEFEQVTQLRPDQPRGFQQLGTVYQALGEYDKALANYDRANALRPEAQTFSNIGILHHRTGNYAAAVAAYQKAITLRPNSATTHRNLGDAYVQLGRREDALAQYHEAVRLAEADLAVSPRDARIVASLAVYLQKIGRSEEARRRAVDALALAPDDIIVWERVAHVHALAGRSDDALGALGRAIQGGYTRAEVAAEDDFASLRALPAFQALIAPAAGEGRP